MNVLRFLHISVIAAAALTASAKGPSDYQKYHEDIVELSMEENLAHPEVPKKAVEPIKTRQLSMARHLKSKGMKVETARDGLAVVVTIGTDALFQPNDTLLTRQAGKQLDMLAHYLKTPDFYKLLIVVHSDNTGSEEYLNSLTTFRADILSEALTARGALAESLVTYGFGTDEPLLPNSNRANRAANRRAEFYFVPGPEMISAARSNKL